MLQISHKSFFRLPVYLISKTINNQILEKPWESRSIWYPQHNTSITFWYVTFAMPFTNHRQHTCNVNFNDSGFEWVRANWGLFLTVFSLSHRQCALVALQDVKAYLSAEGGQIAVSPLSTHLFIRLSLTVSQYWLISRSFNIPKTETSGIRTALILNCPSNILPEKDRHYYMRNIFFIFPPLCYFH